MNGLNGYGKKMNEYAHVWTNGWSNVWTNGQSNVWTNGQSKRVDDTIVQKDTMSQQINKIKAMNLIMVYELRIVQTDNHLD